MFTGNDGLCCYMLNAYLEITGRITNNYLRKKLLKINPQYPNVCEEDEW